MAMGLTGDLALHVSVSRICRGLRLLVRFGRGQIVGAGGPARLIRPMEKLETDAEVPVDSGVATYLWSPVLSRLRRGFHQRGGPEGSRSRSRPRPRRTRPRCRTRPREQQDDAATRQSSRARRQGQSPGRASRRGPARAGDREAQTSDTCDQRDSENEEKHPEACEHYEAADPHADPHAGHDPEYEPEAMLPAEPLLLDGHAGRVDGQKRLNSSRLGPVALLVRLGVPRVELLLDPWRHAPGARLSGPSAGAELP